MPTADEYHEYARECLIAAATAETEKQRRRFMDMARAWTAAALRLQGLIQRPGEERGQNTDGRTVN